ncbi:cellulase family glycosylhydrolase, partial [Candidatus Pacebacteria bacterium]|nr:cellulase family glycosylhydrolase [Candidatus Paceibacterota bacterium]
MLQRIIITILVILLLLAVFYARLSSKPVPEEIQYGMSFNTLYAEELGLDWKETYLAILNDLGVKHFRLAAHWNLIESEKDKFNFEELDFQVDEANKVGADVIFAIGRRLPRWPECHVPSWAIDYGWEDQKEEIREYIRATINHFKDRDNIVYWQVENEPFLDVFAHEHCGDLDVDFLDEEIALVRELDPSRPILVTDSGNIGTWSGAYKRGDAFGTSVYLYLWNPEIGPFKSFLPASFYRFKEGLVRSFYGRKETILIELAAEPWLLEPIIETSKSTQLERMSPEKLKEILEYAKDTR